MFTEALEWLMISATDEFHGDAMFRYEEIDNYEYGIHNYPPAHTIATSYLMYYNNHNTMQTIA